MEAELAAGQDLNGDLGGRLFLNPRLCWGFPQCLQHLWLCLPAIAKPAPGSRLQTSELQAWWKEAYDATFQ